jgi:hypothetical protein
MCSKDIKFINQFSTPFIVTSDEMNAHFDLPMLSGEVKVQPR